MRVLVAMLVLNLVAVAASVPPADAPDPLGRGYMGVYRDDNDTLKIKRVVENSAAAKAGLLPDDIFVRVGPIREPQNFEEVRALIVGLRPGTEVAITVKRGGELKNLTITLAPKPPENVMSELVPQP